MEERFKTVVCVDCILENEEGKILLMRRKNTKFNDGELELPGGHLEKGEDLFDAMIREIKEELDVDLRREDLKLIYLMHHYTKERLNFIFEVIPTNLKPIIGEPNKCSELMWVNKNNIPEDTTEKVKQIISDINNNESYNKW